MNRTRIKICGITRPADALAAINAGADAIGLVFWEPSTRAVTIEQARAICEQVPAFVSIVALSVNAQPAYIEQIIDQLPVSVLQFHGDESPDDCSRFNRPFIKALRVQQQSDLIGDIERYYKGQGILLDAYQKGVPGGTGTCFDWNLIPVQHRQRIILAGGLSAGNVQRAITHIHPWAVDVSGGVESAPGIKDPQKIHDFVAAVHTADSMARANDDSTR